MGTIDLPRALEDTFVRGLASVLSQRRGGISVEDENAPSIPLSQRQNAGPQEQNDNSSIYSQSTYSQASVRTDPPTVIHNATMLRAADIRRQNDQQSDELQTHVSAVADVSSYHSFIPSRPNSALNLRECSIASFMTSPSHYSPFPLSYRTRSPNPAAQELSPRSRQQIIEHQNKNQDGTEPVFINGLLTSCTTNCSIIDMTKGAWKLASKEMNKSFEGLQLGDALLIEFQGAMCLNDGTDIDILEGNVLMANDSQTIVVISHEKIHFSLRGGVMAVNIFVVKRSVCERKYHTVSSNGHAGFAGLKIECMVKIVQGPPQSRKSSYIMENIQNTAPRNSCVLVVGDCVRERLNFPPGRNFLNLKNLRLSNETPPNNSAEPSTEDWLREQHFEAARQRRELLEELKRLCNEYDDCRQTELKLKKIEQLHDALVKLDCLRNYQELLAHRLSAEVFTEAVVIYGSMEAVWDCMFLLDSLRPAVTVVLDADVLSSSDLATVFSVRRNFVYLSCDTPFLWQSLLEWRTKSPMISAAKSSYSFFGSSSRKVPMGELISETFVRKLEKFLSPGVVQAEFFSGREPWADKGIGVLLSCFKYQNESCADKLPGNVVLVKHSRKGKDGSEFEKKFVESVRNLLCMRGQLDTFTHFVNRENSGMFDSAVVSSPEQSSPVQRRTYRCHSSTLVSLDGLTVRELPQLYRHLHYTTGSIFLVGNISELKKTDPYVHQFVTNVQDAGFVRKVMILKCPEHKCDILFGDSIGSLGCHRPCPQRLSCGHPCPKRCHLHGDSTFDDSWSTCKQKCATVLSCGHGCPNICDTCRGSSCPVRCMEILDVRLPCKHRVRIDCWQRYTDITCPKEKCRRVSRIAIEEPK